MSEPSLSRLWETWQAWNGRAALENAERRALDRGETDRAEVLRAMIEREPVVSPTEALAAQHELSSLLAGWEWLTICDARAGGASWDDIARATNTDPANARASYADTVEDQAALHEQYGWTFDADRYRDAIDRPGEPPPAVIETDAEVGLSGAEGPVLDAGPTLTTDDAARALVERGMSPDEAQATVTRYQADVSALLGTPVQSWGLDEADIAAMLTPPPTTTAPANRGLAEDAELRSQLAQWHADDAALPDTGTEITTEQERTDQR